MWYVIMHQYCQALVPAVARLQLFESIGNAKITFYSPGQV